MFKTKNVLAILKKLLSKSCFDSNLLSIRSDDDNRDGSDDTKRVFLFDVAVFCLVIRIFAFMVHIVQMTCHYIVFEIKYKEPQKQRPMQQLCTTTENASALKMY